MGQRCFILIKRNYKDKSTVTLLHHQWGIGKVLPSLLLQEIMYSCYQFRDERFDEENLPIDKFFTFRELNIPNYNYITNKVVDKKEDVFSIPTIVKYGNQTDNNNGGLIIELTQKYNDNGEPKTYGDMFDMRYAFVLGNEETYVWNSELKVDIDIEAPFTRLITVNEFASRTFRANDETTQKYTKKFCTAFNTIATMFGAECVANKKVWKQRAKEAQALRDRVKVELQLLTDKYKETGIKPEIPQSLKDISKHLIYA